MPLDLITVIGRYYW